MKAKELCNQLGLVNWTVEQWIARGLFEARPTIAGKARIWRVSDARKLLIFAELYSSGIPAHLARHHAKRLANSPASSATFVSSLGRSTIVVDLDAIHEAVADAFTSPDHKPAQRKKR